MWTGLLLTLASIGADAPDVHTPAVDVVVVLGAAGSPEYGEKFEAWASHWETAAQQAGARLTLIGREPLQDRSDRELLQQAVQHDPQSPAELWVVLIGHGTFDRREAKFNLRGPDVSANDLKTWLSQSSRPTAIIDTSAASAPFLQALAGPQRVIISATKSGGEQNFAYFGEYLSAAIVNPEADLDKDEQVSLWEAFLFASRRIAEFYKSDGRLQTEHALLDDNGDGQGTRAEAFDGLVATQQSADAQIELDGDRAHQWHLIRSPAEAALSPATRAQRNAIELQIIALKREKGTIAADDYYQRLESLLLQLAELTASPASPR